jgi:imidazolonepropionase-like amidohydrolase
MSLAIVGATIIDGNGGPPIEDGVIVVEGKRIVSVGKRTDAAVFAAKTIDARGKFVIPGLMDANVHLFGLAARLAMLLRYEGRYEDIIIESAQIALKSGLTTVFDTYGPRRYLMAVRDRINAGEVRGSRFFCAGNIVGFDGPLSVDFHAKAAELVSPAFANRINSIWVENVGRHLMWLPPDRVAEEIRAYCAKGIDFLKYGSSEHFNASAGAFLAFSQYQQAAIVEEAHRAGITAQAHSMAVEGLRLAVEAGCDLVTHCNVTGPVPIPESTLELMAKRKTGAVIFPWTEKGLAWIRENVTDLEWMLWQSTDINARNLIRSGAPLLLANDGVVIDQETLADPRYAKGWMAAPEEESLIRLDTGHFYWFRAMEEKGCPPMQMLQAATRNIAVAYRKDKDLGTLERGKIADMVVLDKNPLAAAKNYRSIHMVIKEGAVVDRESLPENPIATKPLAPPAEEEASYIPAITAGSRLPMCPMCLCH